MQSLAWYIRRLRTMSLSEIAWRVQSEVRDLVDRFRVNYGLYPSLREALEGKNPESMEPGFRVCDMEVGEWTRSGASEEERNWCKKLSDKADRILQHKLSYFDLVDHFHGNTIDWNKDHGNDKKAPLTFSQRIDYRDFKVTGDCKYVWEPNRHHQLVVLGRAYRASGDERYAREVINQIESWLDRCPFGMGMNWRSPLELGIRLINWVWAIDLILEAGLVAGEFKRRLLNAVYLHLWEITRKYSRGSSANNHLIGEAAGVFVATCYFPELAHSARWRSESREILIKEILEQTYADGCTREQALGYHLFVLQFFLVSGLAGKQAGEDFPNEYWARLEKMLEFLGRLAAGGGSLPMFGDGDDGYVLDLGEGVKNAGGLLSQGAILFNRSDFKAWAGGYLEPARWLLGKNSKKNFDRITGYKRKQNSKAFEDSGRYLLQWGEKEPDQTISVLFDCGELGFKSIAAHGHADALSFTLRAFGRDIFVDPGTYDYFTYPEWRNYFRSTRAHNTVTVDDADQSVMLGSFMWGERAGARCVEWQPTRVGGTVSGEHDGYARLNDPVIHRRTLTLDGANGSLMIRDDIQARNEHTVSVYFHLSENCKILSTRDNSIAISADGGQVTLGLDARLQVTIVRSQDKPIGGWLSHGYHHKVPCDTIVGSGRCKGNGSFVHRIKISPLTAI
jgi:uncharacterized heparinase superfamily protein